MPRDPKSADNGVSRRRFLQGSSTVAAAAALGTLVRPVHAAGDDTLKLALVGCGNRGTGAIANALQTDRAGEALGHGRRVRRPPGR